MSLLIIFVVAMAIAAVVARTRTQRAAVAHADFALAPLRAADPELPGVTIKPGEGMVYRPSAR